MWLWEEKKLFKSYHWGCVWLREESEKREIDEK